MNIVSYKITSHTSGDDKDRQNGVICSMVRDNVVIFDHPDFHKGLVFRDGDDNTWAPTVKAPFQVSESPRAKFNVTMTGDDGDWKSAFSVRAVFQDGTEHVILSRTQVKTFRSGQSSTFTFPLTS